MDGGPGPDFMYADDAREERPERPGINRLGISQLIDVDETTFNELRSVREKVGYTQLALTNDSQPNDPSRLTNWRKSASGELFSDAREISGEV